MSYPPIAVAGSIFSAARMATTLASAQIASTIRAPSTASPGSCSTYFGKDRRP